MIELPWPPDLAPYKVAFYLQPHVGGQESPITRVKKTYGLSAPRWLARMTFRAGYAGRVTYGVQDGFGPRLDAMIADLEGGLVLTRFHDWRRPRPTAPMSIVATPTCTGAAAGATSLIIAGFAPGSHALSAGDYVGGDGRPHLVSMAATIAAGGIVGGAGSVFADANGRAIVGIKPPLSAPIAAGTAMQWPVTGRFQLVDPDAAGQNEAAVGEDVEMTLDFAEFLL